MGTLNSKLTQFFEDATPTCLFAGAGVGKRAGLPLWGEYVLHLIDVAAKYEEETAALMRKRLEQRKFIDAIRLYKTCPEIPSGVSWSQLAAPFVTPPLYSPSALNSLVALPFSCIVSTNFDRSLHDGYQNLSSVARGNRKSALAVELGDLSMRQAIYYRDFFVARVHGRAEIPTTMVLDNEDYTRTEQDPTYSDFLLHVLRSFRCLWIGYSFVDPAIHHVFAMMAERLPHPYPRLHLALLPTNADVALHTELARFNIETIEYNPTNDAQELWAAIRTVNATIAARHASPAAAVEVFAGLNRLVASAYARLRLGRSIEPLRDVVVEGVVTQALTDAGGAGRSASELLADVKQYITLSAEAVEALLTRVIDRLKADKSITEQDGRFMIPTGAARDDFALAIERVADGVISRLKVREGVEGDQATRKTVEAALRELLMLRGWDLGAHFAARVPDQFEAWDDVEQTLTRLIGRSSRLEAIRSAMFDVLRRPDAEEAAVLTDLGRIAFAVELVVKNSQAVFGLSALLPETIYLDASVVMPAIVEGHPYGPTYADAITRMQTTAGAIGRTVSLVVVRDFLNEVISHRRNAIELVRSLKLDDPQQLRRHIQFYGSETTNVYIAAYASWVGRSEHPLSFEQFLANVAPYNSEGELAGYLMKRGIRATGVTFNDDEKSRYAQVLERLEAKYASDTVGWKVQRPHILVEHEATQVTRLIADIKARRTSIFVTADKQLMRALAGPLLGQAAGVVVSHLGFIQLVDLILGISPDKRSLQRLIWGITVTDTRTVVRNYLIDRALSYYDEAKAMAQWEVVDKMADEMTRAAEAEGVNVFYAAADVARNAQFLDRFEVRFFQKMEEVIRERERQSDPSA